VNQTKNAAFATNYHIKQRKLNFVAIFAHNLVTATEKFTENYNRLQKRKVLVFLLYVLGSCIVTL
jgi:hypothetical protein